MKRVDAHKVKRSMDMACSMIVGTGAAGRADEIIEFDDAQGSNKKKVVPVMRKPAE